MHSYHGAALIVAPLLAQLNIKQSQYDAAMIKLNAAKAQSAAAQAEVDALQAKFEKTSAEQQALQAQARETQDKMTAANNLIASLAGEKTRWASDATTFAANKKKLVGDVALSCAFVSYLGPFNQVFREFLLKDVFYADALNKKIPITKNLSVTDFLVDDAIIAEWNSQGLPKDNLSVQNGILVTQASRYPLLVDPQSQAMLWLSKREDKDLPYFGTTSLSAPKLRDELEFCMQEGMPLMIEGVVKDIDPMFDPVLEKHVIVKGRNKSIILGDKAVGLDDNFRMYFFTKLGNPIFSPELSAKTTIIDFSVTQKGLEDQLLSRVIQYEQKSLEDQRQELIEAVNMNTISLQKLDAELLDRLSNSTGNLLENVELINVLANTKVKSQEVAEKIEKSKETEEIINNKREQYRPVACRASIIYFVIVSLPNINVMYQVSLAQFLQWFDYSMSNSQKGSSVAKRVEILIDYLSYHIYRNVNRGLFEEDKLIYKMMMTQQILKTERPDILNEQMVQMLLRGGAGMAESEAGPNPFGQWLAKPHWLAVAKLARDLDFFGDFRNTIEQNVAEWRAWYESEAPEEMEIPKLEERLSQHPSGHFMRMLIIRCMRDDRLRLAAQTFVGASIGQKYIEPETISLEDVWNDADKYTPVILLLTPGADPTTALQDLSKKKGAKIFSVSMGEGQEKHARKCIVDGVETGGWALLQNCHLGLGFMNEMDENIKEQKKKEEAGELVVDEGFRTWITCEPHKDFPINLLQMSIKVTNEPPAGMKAGLYRSYTSAVDNERLNRVEDPKWRQMVYTVCFLHSTVQERRKFGASGWCIPYEFNAGDLEASLTFLEKHFFAAGSGLSWPTIQYMLCEVQYGGRITDDFDRVLFNTFGAVWLTPKNLEKEFTFTPLVPMEHKKKDDTKLHSFIYNIPVGETTDIYLKYINTFPAHDTPEIFGLNTNADLVFGSQEAERILGTISNTQPQTTSSAGGKTKEEVVSEMATALLEKTPEGFVDLLVRDKIQKGRPKDELRQAVGPDAPLPTNGFTVPLNVFLYQEVTRLNAAIGRVRRTFVELVQAINGEIIMTPDLQDALQSLSDLKPPVSWYVDPSGAEIAWSSPDISNWMQGLEKRYEQLTTWLYEKRPMTYWMTGFFNPQGFLTAARQEITRRNKKDAWALDQVSVTTEVLPYTSETKLASFLRGQKNPENAFYIKGLYLQGASWDSKGDQAGLKESAPKELFTPLPILKVGAKRNEDAAAYYAKRQYYDCPCYTKKKRTDLNYIFIVKLPTARPPEHWTLRGVALLCATE
jgi:dynein heavy chain